MLRLSCEFSNRIDLSHRLKVFQQVGASKNCADNVRMTSEQVQRYRFSLVDLTFIFFKV